MSTFHKVGANRIGQPKRRRAPVYPGFMLDKDLMGVLARSEIALSAYDIAAKLHDNGRHTAIASVYRSLDRLCARHLVEKVHMMSGFRLVDVPRAILMTCTDCGRTASLSVPDHYAGLKAAMAEAGFLASSVALEALGVCQACLTNMS